MQPSRRTVTAALVGLTSKAESAITGGFVDGSHKRGHLLRDGAGFPAARRAERKAVVIVGGGIAGLSAAWRLEKRRFADFVLLELEEQAGGNSRWGENEVSPYPWGAHYVPVPSSRMTLVREIMTDLGLLRDGVWDERHLCHSPQERLYLHGRWQDGIEPEIAATRRDRDDYRRFHDLVHQFTESGEFTLPGDTGARRRGDLDQLSMGAWLRREGFQSPYLNWLVDYSCRDDFGARAESTSAWAGIHYFAARGATGEKGPLTWPEGNGWIVRRLMARLAKYVRTAAMAHRIERHGAAAGGKWRVLAGDTEYLCDGVIFAAPTYLASYLLADRAAAPAFAGEYSPWLTANLTLHHPPAERPGSPTCWDNVIYQSPSLGYVVATHQSLRSRIERTVWTYYWPLTDGTPAANRERMLGKDWGYWKEAILTDLERAHPDIRQCVSRIDIMRLGHGMIRPTPGLMFSAARQAAARPRGTLVFANSDLSGMSLFEEAQYRGVTAAEHILARLGR